MAEEESPTSKPPREAANEVLDGGAFSKDDFMAWLSMATEEVDSSVDELMKLLDAPTDSCSLDGPTVAATQVRFISNPYSSPPIFRSSTSYFTVNGNEESCGSSFSDGESSVMASVDTRGMVNVGGFLDTSVSIEGEARKIDSCDGFDWDWDQCGSISEEFTNFLGEELFDPIF